MRERWESLTTRNQALVAFPTLAILTFLLNVFAFGQGLVRSIIYGLIEGAFFAWLAIVATRNEVARRRGDDS